MKYIFVALFLISLCSCKSKTAVLSTSHVSDLSDSVVSVDSVSCTEIVWGVPYDSFSFDVPSFFNLVKITDKNASSSAMPNAGYVKITKTSKNISSASKSSSSDSSFQTRELPPSHTVIYKTDWKLCVIMAVIVFFFCQCWQFRKKIKELFAGLK